MRITITGDIMFTKEQRENYFCDGKFDIYKAFEQSFIGLKKPDLVIGNLETPVTGDASMLTESLYSFNAPLELLCALRKTGFTDLITANNHCLDRGLEGLIKTIQNIRSYDMRNIGTHMNREQSSVIIDMDCTKVGIMAYTYGTNAFENRCFLNKDERYMVDFLQQQELSRPLEKKLYYSKQFWIRCFRYVLRKANIYQQNIPVYLRREPDRIEKRKMALTIDKCKNDGANLIIVFLHIGGQYNKEPMKFTKDYCQYCIDKGADIVIANHEHVIHGTWGSKKSFIAYSLGNYWSSIGVTTAPFDKYANYSVIYHIDTNGSKVIKISFSLLLCHVDLDGFIISENVSTYYEKNSMIYEDIQVLLNRIYGTEGEIYPVLREYFIKSIELGN